MFSLLSSTYHVPSNGYTALCPDAPTKQLKHHPTATDGNQSSPITIEHHCGSKQIQMTIDETTAGTLLKNFMADKLSLDSLESKIVTVLT
jgi:hypothetical protein